MARIAIFLYTLAFLLHQTSITTAAPANTISSPPTLALVQLNASNAASENIITSASLSTIAASFCAARTTRLLHAHPRRYVWRIPGTGTVLDVYYCPDDTVDGDAMEYALDTAYSAMSNHINAHGDGPMFPPVFDPYETPRIPELNCTVKASSTTHGHLTFGIMLRVLRVLFEFLYDRERFGTAVVGVSDFDIRSDGQQLGTVSIGPYEG